MRSRVATVAALGHGACESGSCDTSTIQNTIKTDMAVTFSVE